MIYNIVANIVNVFFQPLLINGNLGFPITSSRSLHCYGLWPNRGFVMAMMVIIKGKAFGSSFKNGGFKLQWKYIKSIIISGFLPPLGGNHAAE